MYNEDTELLFPLRVIPSLSGMRGEVWDQMISDLVNGKDEIQQKAFVLMMVRLGGCMTCNADSFRAMRGCTLCAQRTVKRVKETDAELQDELQSASEEVQKYLEHRNNS